MELPIYSSKGIAVKVEVKYLRVLNRLKQSYHLLIDMEVFLSITLG